MADDDRLFSPRSLSEALALFVPYPQAQVYAGGTGWQQENPSSPLKLPGIGVSLQLADDLKKITYGDRFLDLGSALPLNQILGVSRNYLNPALKQAVLAMSHSALRNLATLGGNLCQKGFLGDLFPVLFLLGAQFELRSVRTGRWVSAALIAEEGHFPFLPGELLTRVRIPLEDWPLNFYYKVGDFRTAWDERLVMASLARAKNGLLEAFRLAFFLPHSGLLRSRGLEAELTGRKLPLDHKDRESAFEKIDEALSQLTIPASVFQRDRILHMTRWVLTRVDED